MILFALIDNIRGQEWDLKGQKKSCQLADPLTRFRIGPSILFLRRMHSANDQRIGSTGGETLRSLRRSFRR